MQQAYIAGLRPNEVEEMTFGEICEYVEAVGKRIRADAQRQAVIAYNQACLIGLIFGDKKELPDVWDVFHFWTDEEVEELETQREIDAIKKMIYSTGRVKEG